MDLSSLILYICFLGLLIVSIVGLFNFEKTFKLIIRYFDSMNPYNIVYPKGTYARFVIKTTLIMGFFIGFVVTTNFILLLFGTSLQEIIGGNIQ